MLVASGHHAAPPFNGLFYATCATVIPVLFLAIAVQGRIYSDLAATTGRFLVRDQDRAWKRIRSGLVTFLALLAAVWVLVVGVIDEGDAIYALENQTARQGLSAEVAHGTVVLVVVVAVGPALTLGRTVLNLFRRARAMDAADRAAEHGQGHGGESQDQPPEAHHRAPRETGKLKGCPQAETTTAKRRRQPPMPRQDPSPEQAKRTGSRNPAE
jgi:hypothetical protein